MAIMTTKTPSVVYRGNPPSSAHQPDVADIVQQQEEIIAGAVALSDLTEVAADVAAIEAKTDFITVTQAVNLDTLESLATTGRAPKAPVAVATTANVTLSGEQTIDGVLTSTDRVLVKDQSTASENGIYVTAAGAWSRAADLNEDAEIDGAAVYVEGGTVGTGTTWQTTASSITIGTDAMPWVKISGNETVSSLVAGGFPVDKLISAWLFDEGDGDTVADRWGGNPIDLTLPTDPNATRTRQGVRLKSGLIQTPTIQSAREIVILYRTGFDQASGFLISGGSLSGSAVTQDAYPDGDDAVKIAGCGFGLRVPRSRLNGPNHQAVKELNRGTWTVLFRALDANYNTAIGLGGRHSTTTSRCEDFEIAYAFAFDAALTDDERNEVIGWLRKRAAADKGILFHRDDAPETAPLTVILGDSQADGRASFTDWPAFEQNTNFAPFMNIMAGGEGDVRRKFFAGLVLGVSQKVDSAVTNGGIEQSAGLELALASDYASDLDEYTFLPHVVKYGVGGSTLAPSSTGTAANGITTWSVDELATSSIFHNALMHIYRACGVLVERGIGFDEVKFAIYLGTNDATDTADAPDSSTYQGYCQDFWDEITTRLPGIEAKAIWFRPAPFSGSDATAFSNVQAGIDAFGTANSDVTVIDTDGHTLTSDGVHYAPAAYGLQAAAVISA